MTPETCGRTSRHLISRDPARKLLLEGCAALLDDDVSDLDGTLRSAAPAGATGRVLAAGAGGDQQR